MQRQGRWSAMQMGQKRELTKERPTRRWPKTVRREEQWTRDTIGKAVAVNELIGEHADKRAERRWAETARRAEWQKRGACGGKCPKTRIVQYERVLRMG